MASRVAVLLIIVAAAVPAGCGNDDSASEAPTKATYLKQADAVCRTGNARLAAERATFFAAHPDANAADDQKYGIEVFVPNLEAQIAKLRTLRPPPGDAAEVLAVWDAATAGLAELKTDPASFGGTRLTAFARRICWHGPTGSRSAAPRRSRGASRPVRQEPSAPSRADRTVAQAATAQEAALPARVQEALCRGARP